MGVMSLCEKLTDQFGKLGIRKIQWVDLPYPAIPEQMGKTGNCNGKRTTAVTTREVSFKEVTDEGVPGVAPTPIWPNYKRQVIRGTCVDSSEDINERRCQIVFARENMELTIDCAHSCALQVNS
ncbi:MAG: hypothetical protein BGP25_00010 [Lysobacterales bacterium 63-13]|nr:MAG: hypothetical protein BGP25_00010 [Xanthomonadales bacterium 63-13]